VVKNARYTARYAFTLIELIFAIVIIAISVVSLPMMTRVTSEGLEANLVQEAIFAASATLSDATTYNWDENSTDDESLSEFSRVVNTGGCIAGAPNKRLGHIHRQCLNNNATLPYTLNAYNRSVDFAAHTASSIFIAGSTPSAASYKKTYDSTVTVTTCKAGETFTQFGLEADNPNLKEIEIKITPTGSADTLVLLRAYSANIGEVEVDSRTMP